VSQVVFFTHDQYLYFSLSSTERPGEYTEVPLGALDIAAADSLTLSPPPGRFNTVPVSVICVLHLLSEESLKAILAAVKALVGWN